MPCCEYSPIRKPGKNPVPLPGEVIFEPANPPPVIFCPIDIGDAIANAVVDGYDRRGGDPTGEPKVIGSIRNNNTLILYTKFAEPSKS